MSELGQDYYKYGEENQGGGSGVGGITIKDEGIEKGIAKSLDFKGANILATEDPANPGSFFIYSPPSSYVSHYNQSDGSSSAMVANFPTLLRNVSNPLGLFNIGDWIPGNSYNCFNNSIITYNSSYFSILNTSTNFNVQVFDANGVTVLASNSIVINGNTTNTTNNITIQISNFSADTDKYKAQSAVSINIAAIIPNGGRISIKITHSNGGDGTWIKQQNNIFYDPNTIQPTISGCSISENTPNKQIKQLSGVNFYTTNSQFIINVTGIDYLNHSSYPTNQVEINTSEYGIPSFLLRGSDLTGWTNNYNNIGASYLKNNAAITTSNYYLKSLTTNIYSRWIDWVNGSYINSIDKSIMIDTFIDNSTNSFEDFRTESRRLTNDYTTLWNSTQNLSSYDGGDGLQVIGSELIYPKENFSIYQPDSISQPNYSILTGDKNYKRKFTSATSKSNGILTFTSHNFTETNLTNGDLQILISRDKINWYTTSGDYIGGVLTNGDSCRINRDTNNLGLNSKIEFTFGTGGFSTELYIKIIYKDSVIGRDLYLGSFNINWI